MRRYILPALVAAILLLLGVTGAGCTASNSTATTSSASGGLQLLIVDSSTSNPLQGAKVVSNSQPDGQSKVTGITQVEGTVTFVGIKTGDYTFSISHANYFPTELALTVTGPDTRSTIKMTRVPGTTTTTSANPVNVSFADLVARPADNSEKIITVEGFWFDGFEIVTLAERLEPSTFAPSNIQPAGEKIWIIGGLPAAVSSQLYVQANNPTGYPAHYGKVELTGTFQYGGKYGHMDAYKYQLSVTDAKYIQWNPPMT